MIQIIRLVHLMMNKLTLLELQKLEEGEVAGVELLLELEEELDK